MSRLILLLVLWGTSSYAHTGSYTKLLLSCNIQTQEIGQIEVYYASENPGQVTIVHNSTEGVNIGVQEWHQKTLTLPSQKKYEYHLIKANNQWVLRQSNQEELKYYPISCH